MLIAFIVLSVVLLILLFFLSRTLKTTRQEIDAMTRKIEEDQRSIREEAIKAAEKELEKARQESRRAREEAELVRQSLLMNIDRELENYRKIQENELAAEKDRALVDIENYRAIMLEKLFEEREEIEFFIAPLKKELEEHKAKISAHNQTIMAQHLDEMAKDFYKIKLTSDDKSDIEYLLDVEKHIKNKEVLRKLIYDTYLRPSLAVMFKRVLDNKDEPGIYKITDDIGRAYIGRSTKVKSRWTSHIKESLGIGGISHQEIHNALREKGWDSFTFEILENCSKEVLAEREKYYIDFYETNTAGYNMKIG